MTTLTAPLKVPAQGRATFLRRFRRQPLAMTGAVIVAVVILAAVLAPWLSPYDPNATSLGETLLPPGSGGHVLGTDELGRDLLSRLIAGAQVSLTAGLLGTGLTLLIGVPLGLIAGYSRGRADTIIMFFTDVMMSIPAILLALAIAGMLGPNLVNAMIAVAVATAPRALRIVRGSTLAIREETYIEAARSLGTPEYRIILRHVVPNILPPVIVFTTVLIGSVMLLEAGLSFIGVGVQPPQASWGAILASGFNYSAQAPWLAILPGLCIAVTVFALNLMGDGIRDSIGKKVQR